MYTNEMRMAFHSITPPKGFGVQLEDNDQFLTIRVKEDIFMRLHDDEKRAAIEYMVRIKAALEDNGAIVLIVREGGKDD